MICWYCHWGWPKRVAEIYEEAAKQLGGDAIPLDYGPSHLVWADENFDAAEWCLEHFDEYTKHFDEEQLPIVRWSLEELVKIPLEERDIWPEDYDGKHPENYPPTVEVKRVWY